MPAELSGVRKGDIIKEIDGKAMATLGEIINYVSYKPIGSTLNISITRNGKIYDYNLLLREKEVYKKIQNMLENIYFNYGLEVDINSITGNVVISYLSPMGMAYQSGLKKGDVILSVNGYNVTNLDEFLKIVKKNNYITQLRIHRGARDYTVEFQND